MRISLSDLWWKNDMVNWHNRHNFHEIVHLRRLHKVFAQCWRARQSNEIWNLKYIRIPSLCLLLFSQQALPAHSFSWWLRTVPTSKHWLGLFLRFMYLTRLCRSQANIAVSLNLEHNIQILQKTRTHSGETNNISCSMLCLHFCRLFFSLAK